jgi:hypothetical protein
MSVNLPEMQYTVPMPYRDNAIVKPLLTFGFVWEQEEELSDSSPVVDPRGVALGPLLSPVVSVADEKL